MQVPRLGRMTDVGTMYDQRQRLRLVNAARDTHRKHASSMIYLYVQDTAQLEQDCR